MTPVTPHAVSARPRRRSKRLGLALPVVIQGKNKIDESFTESTQMLCVSAHGGLVAVSAAIQKATIILITNLTTSEQQEARVVFIGHTHGRKYKVGFEFVGAATNFWRVHFPSEANRPLKTREHEKVAV
jgi:hypothetical protein